MKLPVLLFLSIASASGVVACKRRSEPAPPPPPAVAPTPAPAAAPPAAEPAPAPAPAPGAVESSVRTPAPARATGCPASLPNAALGAGTIHNNAVAGNETWTLEDSPHRLPEGVTIGNGATLSVAPCAVVLTSHGYAIHVDEGGTLLAAGDPQRPIRFGSDNPTPQAGDWSGIWIDDLARRTTRIATAIIEHAGGEGDIDRAAGLVNELAGLDVQHVTLRANRGFGISVQSGGSFAPTATGITVTGTIAANAARTGAVQFIQPEHVHTLPSGTYTGNAIDEVLIVNGGTGDGSAIRQSGVWRNPGVPYHINENVELAVEGPTGPVLTIAPGNTLRFGRGSQFTVGWHAEGGLVMDGGSEAGRITLTSAGQDTSPAQWIGISFGERFNRSGSKLNFVTIRNAGAESQVGPCHTATQTTNQAAIYLLAAPPPTFIAHTTFANAGPGAAGIARNFVGAVDFAAPALGNDFSSLGSPCRQSPAQTAGQNCPEPESARCN